MVHTRALPCTHSQPTTAARAQERPWAALHGRQPAPDLRDHTEGAAPEPCTLLEASFPAAVRPARRRATGCTAPAASEAPSSQPHGLACCRPPDMSSARRRGSQCSSTGCCEKKLSNTWKLYCRAMASESGASR
eukprot:358252-Chlamydomonas_euryale.AAC.2